MKLFSWIIFKSFCVWFSNFTYFHSYVFQSSKIPTWPLKVFFYYRTCLGEVCIALYLYLIWSSRACTIHSTQLALIRSVNNWTKGENKRTVLYIHSSRTIVNSESLNPPSGTNYFRKGYVMYTGFVYVRFVAYNMQIRDIKISKMMNQHLNKVTSLIWLPSSDRYFIFKHIEFL